MLDPTYEPDDARTLMRTLNESLRSMLGHGAEDWVSERVKPWREHIGFLAILDLVQQYMHVYMHR